MACASCPRRRAAGGWTGARRRTTPPRPWPRAARPSSSPHFPRAAVAILGGQESNASCLRAHGPARSMGCACQMARASAGRGGPASTAPTGSARAILSRPSPKRPAVVPHTARAIARPAAAAACPDGAVLHASAPLASGHRAPAPAVARASWTLGTGSRAARVSRRMGDPRVRRPCARTTALAMVTACSLQIVALAYASARQAGEVPTARSARANTTATGEATARPPVSACAIRDGTDRPARPQRVLGTVPRACS